MLWGEGRDLKERGAYSKIVAFQGGGGGGLLRYTPERSICLGGEFSVKIAYHNDGRRPGNRRCTRSCMSLARLNTGRSRDKDWSWRMRL